MKKFEKKKKNKIKNKNREGIIFRGNRFFQKNW